MQVIYDRQQPGLLTQALVNWGLGTWMDNYNNRGIAKDIQFASDFEAAKASQQKASIISALQKNRSAWTTATTEAEKQRYAKANDALRKQLYQIDPVNFNEGVLNADTSDQGLSDLYSKYLGGVQSFQNMYNNNKRYANVMPTFNSRYFSG